MGRRSGFAGLINAVARDMARSARQAEVARRRHASDLARSQREAERAAARIQRDGRRTEKEAKQRHIQDRLEEAEDRTQAIFERGVELSSVLAHTLAVNDRIDFDALRVSKDFRPFDPPASVRDAAREPRESDFTDLVQEPSGLSRFVPGAQKRFEAAIATAREDFERALAAHRRSEEVRRLNLKELTETYERDLLAFLETASRRNAEVGDLEQRYQNGDVDAVITYNSMVLERSEYPDGFPDAFEVAYVTESKELVIDFELPPPSIVPATAEVKYNRSRDALEEKPRKASDIRDQYQDLVASIALRTVHEVFEADHCCHIGSVAFSGYVCTVDPSIGKDIRPYLISVRVTRDRFAELDLARVDKTVCLRNLGAQVSPRPTETQPIKPIVDFDMVDKRFVDERDVLHNLESRPNLMDLSPAEFEALVSNLFAALGLETKLTRSTKDGGVDVVAFDLRPVLGGKVVIQAKRWKNTVGVSAVRDLFGTMLNEGANKGILVTTSGYGADAFEFSKDKPIELISGSGLLYLLDQIGTKAKILMPEE